LPRKLVEAGLQPRAGVETILVQPAAGMDGGKAEEAQDAEIILANAVRGIADETHPARPQVVHALQWIENRPMSVAIKGVDREVAPACIFYPIGGEGDAGMTPERFDIEPQRRHLDGERAGV